MKDYFVEALIPVFVIVLSSIIMVSCVAGVITGKNPIAAMCEMGHTFFFANKHTD